MLATVLVAYLITETLYFKPWLMKLVMIRSRSWCSRFLSVMFVI